MIWAFSFGSTNYTTFVWSSLLLMFGLLCKLDDEDSYFCENSSYLFFPGTKNLIELHGSLYKTRCTQCHEIKANYDSPICEALRGDFLKKRRHIFVYFLVFTALFSANYSGVLLPCNWFAHKLEFALHHKIPFIVVSWAAK